MRCAVLLLFVASLAGMQPAAAQAPAASVPKIVQAGLDAYKTGGPDEAVRVWLRGSALEGSKEAASYLSTLHQTQELYGNFRASELIGIRVLSRSSYLAYVSLDYDRGPLFARFTIYRTELGSILTSIALNTDGDAILPPPAPLSPQ